MVSLCFTPCSAQAAWQSPACLGLCLVAVQTPVASFEDEEKEFTIISKFIGELCDLIRRFRTCFSPCAASACTTAVHTRFGRLAREDREDARVRVVE